MSNESGPDVRISIEVGDESTLSPRLRNALAEVAEALACEEIAMTDELADALAENDDVSGFNFGNTLKLGDIGGGAFSATRTEFCGSYQVHGGMGTCTLYGAEEGDPPLSKCTLRFW